MLAMRKRLLILVPVLSAHPFASGSYWKQPCKTPEIAAQCFKAHGRLQAGNGTPSVRFWPIESHRLYGIYSNAFGFEHGATTLDNEDPELPWQLTKYKRRHGGWTVYGDFDFCPLEPVERDHMQAACIASASHVVAARD